MNCWLIIFMALLISVLVAWAVTSQIRENLQMRDPKLQELYMMLKQLCENAHKLKNDPEIDVERLQNMCDKLDKIKLLKGDQSYTINKEKIYMCLYDENGEYYPRNLLFYVIAHEYSHSISKSIGHTPEFDDNFQFILNCATKLGLYDPNIPIDLNYCKYAENKD